MRFNGVGFEQLCFVERGLIIIWRVDQTKDIVEVKKEEIIKYDDIVKGIYKNMRCVIKGIYILW